MSSLGFVLVRQLFSLGLVIIGFVLVGTKQTRQNYNLLKYQTAVSTDDICAPALERDLDLLPRHPVRLLELRPAPELEVALRSQPVQQRVLLSYRRIEYYGANILYIYIYKGVIQIISKIVYFCRFKLLSYSFLLRFSG